MDFVKCCPLISEGRRAGGVGGVHIQKKTEKDHDGLNVKEPPSPNYGLSIEVSSLSGHIHLQQFSDVILLHCTRALNIFLWY